MDKIAIAKNVTSFVVGAGTTRIVGSIIANNVSSETAIQKVAVGSASFVIGAMAADATKAYTSSKIDQAVAWYNDNFTGKTASE